MKQKQGMDRRSFMMGLGLTGVAAVGALAGCAPTGKSEDSKKDGVITWDKTVDVLIAGSGCGLYAALVAAQEGASVCVVEKGSMIGGTTALSGSMCWVPNNVHMEKEGVKELPDAEVVAFLQAADAYGNADKSRLEHYVAHAKNVFSYLETALGFSMSVRMSFPLRGDYYNLPGALPKGRSMDFLNAEGKPTGSKTFTEMLLPKADELGVEILGDTSIVELVIDETGRAIGAKTLSKGNKEQFIKAEKGVFLATGGFDWNKDMVKAYHRGPLYTSVGVPTNTGDGHLIGMAVGAGLSNMQNSWGVQAIVAGETEEFSKLSDWGSARSKPNSLLVNVRGRRFTNEASSYATCNPSFYAYDAGTCTYQNLPAYLVFDQTYVDFYGFPAQKTKEGEALQMPDYVKMYESLEALAQANGIEASGLQDEITRFNGFAQTGQDSDWHRGEWAFDTGANGDLTGLQQGLASSCMGPVQTPPFYCVKMGPGCCGTSGGLAVDEQARVLQAVGAEPIEGLYALGNCSASIFGSAYPGSGATVGAGVFQGLMGVQHALGYSKY